jgi:hypothetical protein
MESDVPMIEDGGKTDFHYGKDWQVMGQPPVKVDRVLRKGDAVALGDVMLTAYNTPGHTRGSTTWVTTLFDSGRAHKVVFPDGAGFNPGYRVAKDPSCVANHQLLVFLRRFYFRTASPPDVRRWLCLAVCAPSRFGLCPSFGFRPVVKLDEALSIRTANPIATKAV